MNNKESDFQKLLIDKYGEGVVNELYDLGRLQAENIKKANPDSQAMVASHMKNLFVELKKGDVNEWIEAHYKSTSNEATWDKKSWAFDFSGWLGSLDFNKEHLKKYMIVGLEPHVERYDYQIVYGLSDNAPGDLGKRFRIDPKEKEFVRCTDDSSLIWTNLLNIFGNESLISKVKKKDESALIDFLDQFYIADLCHFAPRGPAGEIHKIKGWSAIRFETADKFLQQEIKLINPEVVIAQGVGVFHELLKIYKVESYVTYMDKNKRLVLKANLTIDGNYIKLISIPHFGSKMMKNTFWIKHIKSVKDILEEKEIINYNKPSFF